MGATLILRYDPLGRLVRTDLPNGTFSKVEFDPWQEARFDPNDTVLASIWYQARQGLPAGHPEKRAAQLTTAHANIKSNSPSGAGRSHTPAATRFNQ